MIKMMIFHFKGEIMFKKYYYLNDYSERQIARATEFVKKAMVGLINEIADEKIGEMINEFKNRPFTGDSELHWTFTVDLIGNDILAALGAAKIEEKL
jgi:hypothetical protein